MAISTDMIHLLHNIFESQAFPSADRLIHFPDQILFVLLHHLPLRMRKFLGILALLAVIGIFLPGAVYSQNAYYEGDGVNEGEIVLKITLLSPSGNGWRQQPESLDNSVTAANYPNPWIGW